jgi:diacylglycerol kinase family enzyme
MPHRKCLRATLIHNKKAGGGAHCRSDLEALLQRAEYRVAYYAAKHCDLAAALAAPADLVVVAGGDGTVARVARKARAGAPPIAILPLGIANNVAHSLGTAGALDDLVAGWRDVEPRPFYPLTAIGPWGTRRLVEGIGFGAIEQGMAYMTGKPGIAEARRAVAERMVSAAPECLELRLDGETIEGRFSVLELTAIPLVGPNLRLAAATDPSEPRFEICFIGDSREERQALSRWAADPEHAGPAPLSLRLAGRATISGQYRRLRLDGRLWPKKPGELVGPAVGPITLSIEPKALHFLASG